MTYNQQNGLTYLFNQQNKAGRHDLVNIIQVAGNVSKATAIEAAKSYCLTISLLFDIWFKNKTINHVGIYGLFKFVFDNGMVNVADGFQKESSFSILQAMQNQNIISIVKFTDIDSSYPGETRATVYNKLLERMKEPDFICARVCFGADSSSDHALIVTNNDKGRPVVLDTSYRSHEWPGNSLESWVTSGNIRWFTEMI